MLIAIVGTRCSGVSSVEDFLVSVKGFTSVRLFNSSPIPEDPPPPSDERLNAFRISLDSTITIADNSHSQSTSTTLTRDFSFLSMSSSTSTSFPSPDLRQAPALYFPSADDLLDHVTRNWRAHFVTTDLTTHLLVQKFAKRPFFMLVSVDAPLLDRFHRSESSSLEHFIREHDRLFYGLKEGSHSTKNAHSSLRSFIHQATIHILNTFDSIPALHHHIESLDLLNPEHLRPRWDTYFMTLASLASLRSNCMKRRVGAILVRENRIVSTGYNGTPRGLPNCNEGGCHHCNEPNLGAPLECVCLHAEENALLEAGRERVGYGAVLYCNTCPCLKCTVKIIQTGVKEVVYNLSYKVDDASASLFKQAGVALRRHAINPTADRPHVYPLLS